MPTNEKEIINRFLTELDESELTVAKKLSLCSIKPIYSQSEVDEQKNKWHSEHGAKLKAQLDLVTLKQTWNKDLIKLREELKEKLKKCLNEELDCFIVDYDASTYDEEQIDYFVDSVFDSYLHGVVDKGRVPDLSQGTDVIASEILANPDLYSLRGATVENHIKEPELQVLAKEPCDKASVPMQTPHSCLCKNGFYSDTTGDYLEDIKIKCLCSCHAQGSDKLSGTVDSSLKFCSNPSREIKSYTFLSNELRNEFCITKEWKERICFCHSCNRIEDILKHFHVLEGNDKDEL